MPALDRGIWVVAANHQQARLFTALTETAPITVSETIDNPDAGVAEHDLHHHSAGQGSNSATGRRSMMQPHSEGKKGVNQAFARTVAARIEALRTAGALMRLHVVADPGTLGLLRGAWSKDSARLVVSESGHDPGADDEATLRALLPKSL